MRLKLITLAFTILVVAMATDLDVPARPIHAAVTSADAARSSFSGRKPTAQFGVDPLAASDQPGDFLRILKSPRFEAVPRGEAAEFTILVLNTSNRVDLVDVVVDDPLVPDCNRTIGNLPANSNYEPYTCRRFNLQAPLTNQIFVRGVNPTNKKQDVASDTAVVDVLDLAVELVAAPTSLPEPGGEVTFDLMVENTGSAEFSLTGLTSNQFGDLTNPKNPLVLETFCPLREDLPLALAVGEVLNCSFTAELNGQPGLRNVVVTAEGEEFRGEVPGWSGQAEIVLTDSPAVLAISLSAIPAEIVAPGGDVTFSVELANQSAVDGVTVQQLIDDRLGSLHNHGSCRLPQLLAPGASYECSYGAAISGRAGDRYTSVVTANGIDDDDPPGAVSGLDSATVQIIQPASHALILPVVWDGVDEPNNKCSQAFPLAPNHMHSFFADDVEDWYYFDLVQNATVEVDLVNFLPLEGQIVVYVGAACNALVYVRHNGNFEATKIVPLGTLSSGRYHVRVINAGPINAREPYFLTVKVQ